MPRIALFGYRGFFGSAIQAALSRNAAWGIRYFDRQGFDRALSEGDAFDYVINAAMPSARFWAEENPLLDFDETVAKTMKIASAFPSAKIIQISSISARTQLDRVYGRNKLAAEGLLDPARHLVYRFGPLYGENLVKGVILDILYDRQVYVSGDTRYAFTPIGWLAAKVIDNLHLTGVHEVGARGHVVLKDLAIQLQSRSEFVGENDDQVFGTVFEDSPNAADVIEFARKLKAAIKQ